MEDVKNIYMTNDLNLRWMNGVRKFLVSSAELGKDIFPGEIKKLRIYVSTSPSGNDNKEQIDGNILDYTECCV